MIIIIATSKIIKIKIKIKGKVFYLNNDNKMATRGAHAKRIIASTVIIFTSWPS